MATSYARPASDVTTEWLPSSGSAHYALLDETSASDADFVFATATGQTETIKLGALSTPAGGSNLLVRYRVSAARGNASGVASLLQGTTVIQSDTERFSAGTYTMTVTPATWASITDWSDLRLRIVSGTGEDLGETSGLLFPENGASPSSTNVAFYFDDPGSDGLPIWGPSNAGVTLIWKYKPSQQTGYYTTFFWGRGDGTFLAGEGYWGAHPYPQSGGGAGTAHYWEISISGGDNTTTRASTPKTVVKDGTWYTQALRIEYTSANSKRLIFYTSLPSTANADVIDYVEDYTNYGISPATTDPILIWGDARWAPGSERANGVIRHIKIFDTLLSESDTLAEAASESIVTSAGAANIWYRKINPTPTDLLCDSGTAREPAWRNASYKASLWTP